MSVTQDELISVAHEELSNVLDMQNELSRWEEGVRESGVGTGVGPECVCPQAALKQVTLTMRGVRHCHIFLELQQRADFLRNYCQHLQAIANLADLTGIPPHTPYPPADEPDVHVQNLHTFQVILLLF